MAWWSKTDTSSKPSIIDGKTADGKMVPTKGSGLKGYGGRPSAFKSGQPQLTPGDITIIDGVEYKVLEDGYACRAADPQCLAGRHVVSLTANSGTKNANWYTTENPNPSEPHPGTGYDGW